jgi:hypothetical protein
MMINMLLLLLSADAAANDNVAAVAVASVVPADDVVDNEGDDRYIGYLLMILFVTTLSPCPPLPSYKKTILTVCR